MKIGKAPIFETFKSQVMAGGVPLTILAMELGMYFYPWEQTEKMVVRVPMLTFQHLGNCIGVEMLTIKPLG